MSKRVDEGRNALSRPVYETSHVATMRRTSRQRTVRFGHGCTSRGERRLLRLHRISETGCAPGRGEQIWVWWSLRRSTWARETSPTPTSTLPSSTGPMPMARARSTWNKTLAAGRVLGVLRDRVKQATVHSWELRLAFENGAALLARPHPQYEAWAASIPGEPPLYCPPGAAPLLWGLQGKLQLSGLYPPASAWTSTEPSDLRISSRVDSGRKALSRPEYDTSQRATTRRTAAPYWPFRTGHDNRLR